MSSPVKSVKALEKKIATLEALVASLKKQLAAKPAPVEDAKPAKTAAPAFTKTFAAEKKDA